MRGGASGGGDCGRRTNHVKSERAAASTMGVPAYELLQSITRKKTEGSGNEKIGSFVKEAKRNQSSERGLLLKTIFVLF